MNNSFQEALRALKNLDTPESLTAKTAKITNTIHNTAAALREGDKKSQTSKRLTAKTAKITIGYKDGELGLTATWSRQFGYVSLHDPVDGEWWNVKVKDAPEWALNESRKRKELYKGGNRGAYRLTSQEMEEIWEAEHTDDVEVGIVEDHPTEED
jgi:hypothetical protein